MKRKFMYRLFLSAIIFTLIAWVISCAVNPVTGKREFMLLTESDEIALGAQTDAEIIATYGLYEDAELTNYISTMGRKMGLVTHRPTLDYSFKILDTPVVNAFAVPGGFVYFTRGIMAYLNDEAELAGVMAHELGHVNARHSAQSYSKSQLAQLGLGIGAALSETFAQYAQIASFGVSMLFLKFSRDNEREADALGVEYSTKSGYNSTAMAKFFETLERLNPSSGQDALPAWFSTHPNPPDRIKAVLDDTKKWQSQIAGTNFVYNRDQYLTKIQNIVVGDDPRQGYVDGNMFYHPSLKFQFPVPTGFTLNNTPSQVQMFNEAQDAIILMSMANAATPAEAANAFVSQSQATVQRSEATTVNGLAAHRLITTMQTDQATLEILSHFIKLDNAIYVFHGYSTLDKFNTYATTFDNTMKQFKRLTDSRRINVTPKKLSVVKVRSRATLQNIFQQNSVPANQMESLAILNGMNLSDLVDANSLVKISK
ncbi:M48 family metalloprotease [candidate division KSB1 bacterium]|nr:M48 family metalloprotease [candidate division KSB1 bacterium]